MKKSDLRKKIHRKNTCSKSLENQPPNFAFLGGDEPHLSLLVRI